MQELTRVLTIQVTNITPMRGKVAEVAPKDKQLIEDAAVHRIKSWYGADNVTAKVQYFIRDMDEVPNAGT